MPRRATPVLDNPRLVDAILSTAGQLCISSHFYFYVLARHVLRRCRNHRSEAVRLRRFAARNFFAREWLRQPPHAGRTSSRQYVSDMLIALTRATRNRRSCCARTSAIIRFSQRHLPREHATAQSAGAPDLAFYEQIGRTNYQLVASHATARRCELRRCLSKNWRIAFAKCGSR